MGMSQYVKNENELLPRSSRYKPSVKLVVPVSRISLVALSPLLQEGSFEK